MADSRAGRLLIVPIVALALAGCQSAARQPVDANPAPPSPAGTTAAVPGDASQASQPGAVTKSGTSGRATHPSGPAAAGSALALLSTLTVAGRGPKTGYGRAQFGPAWDDVDHNGCDTRNDVLNRDLTDRTWRAGTHDCVVLSGVLAEPYTGRVVTFSKSHAGALQIDHVVALSDAWQKGAPGWPASERLSFANDPLELLAVDGPTNAAKGDGDAATWLPPSKSYRCAYVARQVAVKAKYRLTVTAAEHDAIARVLAGCPAQRVPPAGSPAQSSPSATTLAGEVPAQPAATSTTLPFTPVGGNPVYYRNCAAVRAAGTAPLHRGSPGYRAGLDGDDDGSACE